MAHELCSHKHHPCQAKSSVKNPIPKCENDWIKWSKIDYKSRSNQTRSFVMFLFAPSLLPCNHSEGCCSLSLCWTTFNVSFPRIIYCCSISWHFFLASRSIDKRGKHSNSLKLLRVYACHLGFAATLRLKSVVVWIQIDFLLVAMKNVSNMRIQQCQTIADVKASIQTNRQEAIKIKYGYKNGTAPYYRDRIFTRDLQHYRFPI